MTDGSRCDTERTAALGDPERALDDGQMIEKARMLLEYSDSDSKTIDTIIDGVLSLAKDNSSNVVELVNHQFS
jgi:hypothetical protein